MAFKNFPLPSTLPITAPNGKKWNFLVMYGDDWPTDMYNEMPTFAATYASAFVSFPNAVSEMPLCFPSRASYMTGRSSRYTTVTSNDDGATYMGTFATTDPIMNTLPVALRRAGYYTGWVGKIYNGLGEVGTGGFGTLPWKHPGIDYMAGQWGAPDYFEWDELGSDGTIRANHHAVDTNVAGTDYAIDVERIRALEFLTTVPTGRPWFLNWPTKGCHQGNHAGGEPEPPSRYSATSVTYTDDASFGVLGSTLGIPDWADNEAVSPWDAAAVTAVHFSHTQALRVARAVDEALCAVLAQIESRGETQNTIIILANDNAIGFGNLRMNGKGTPHRSSCDLLLKVKVPGVSAGTSYAPVCNYDIAPTICALAGAIMPTSPFGMSFHPCLLNKSYPWREAALMTNTGKTPKFWALKFGDSVGSTHYRIMAGGGNTIADGGWNDAAQTTNVRIDGARRKLSILESSL